MTTTTTSSYIGRNERLTWDALARQKEQFPLTPDQIRRILATVDALEKIARHFDDRDCDSHGGIPLPCDFCMAVTEPVLAALEAK